jgi:uncharacterized protein YaaN involved in tellurite resistance
MTDEIKAPKGVNADGLKVLKDKSKDLMVQIKEKTTPKMLAVIDAVGNSSQKKMLASNDLMSKSVGSLLTDLNGKSPAAENLMELRTCMDTLNPASLRNSWWFGIVPKPIKRYAINNFVYKYQPMSTHVDSILDGLRAGFDKIIELNISMTSQYDSLTDTMNEIRADIFVCDNTYEQVLEFEASMDKSDQLELTKVEQAKGKLSRKIRDLRTKEQAVIQFFVSLEQSFVSNDLLSDQIESALSVGPMVMYNALQIQAGLAQQKQIKEGLENFQEGLSDMMAQNAKATKLAVEDIASLYNNPVLALDKMEQGFNDLMSAVDTANQAIADSTKSAQETSERLKDMSAAFQPTVEGMKQNRLNDGKISELDLPALEKKED